MSIKILIDSTADVDPGMLGAFLTIPLTVRFGEEEYQDGVTIDHKKFYEKLVASQELPTTSQATPASFEEIFAQVTAAGDELIVLTIASKLSGTYQSAMIAAEDYPGVYVVDSGSTTIGMGLLAQLARKLAEEGATALQIVQSLEAQRDRVEIVALFDTLEYLKRGGRISKTAAVAGALLNIKPVLRVSQGAIETLGKARGTKQGILILDQKVAELGGIDPDMPVLLGYTGLSQEGLDAYRTASTHGIADAPVAPIGSVVGTHAGPGAFAIAFFSNKEKA